MKNIKTYREMLKESSDFRLSPKAQEMLRLATRQYYSEPVKKLRDLLASGEINVNEPLTENGSTALIVASYSNDLAVMQACIDAGAMVNAVNNVNGRTALWNVCKNGFHGNTRGIEMLLKNGADPNHLDKEGRSVLHACATDQWYAERFAVKNKIDMLVAAGADPNLTDPEGKTPLGLLIDDWRSRKKRHARYPEEMEDAWKELIVAAKAMINAGADALQAFDGTAEVLEFFKGNVDWMPEGPLSNKLQRMQRGKSAFGM